jgi:hypothetical protein
MENNQQKIAKQILDNSIYGVYNKEMDLKINQKSIEIRKNNSNIVSNIIRK